MSYEPTQWKAGDTVTSAKLNKIEQGIANGGIRFVHMSDTGETYVIPSEDEFQQQLPIYELDITPNDIINNPEQLLILSRNIQIPDSEHIITNETLFYFSTFQSNNKSLYYCGNQYGYFPYGTKKTGVRQFYSTDLNAPFRTYIPELYEEEETGQA